MTAATDDVLLDVAGGIARLRINRPAQRNALSASVFSGLREGVAAVARDDSARVLVLEGAGDTAFCAGGDLREMAADGDALQAHRNRGMLAELFGDLWQLGKPTIARVHAWMTRGESRTDFASAAAEWTFIASARCRRRSRSSS